MGISTFPTIRQTLSLHSNESRHVKRIINKIYVGVNVINMCVEFQVIPLMAIEKKIVWKKYLLCCHRNLSNSAI